MTTTHIWQAMTLEDEVQALAARWSRTGLERVQIAREMAPKLTRYQLQGGTHVTAWLKGLGWSHGSAINLIGAARALDAGLTSDSVSELADLGHLLKRGKQVGEVQALQTQKAAHKKLVEEAGIGLGSVRYPTDSAPEMAGIVLRLVDGYRRSGLTVPELPELTLAAFRLADQRLTYLPKMEGVPEPKPRPARLDPYAWLAEQPGPCDVPRCAAPWHHLHHLALTDHARRGHPAARLTILKLCNRHHLTGDASAVHGPEGEQAFLQREFGGREYALEIVLFRTAEYAEYLNGGTP